MQPDQYGGSGAPMQPGQMPPGGQHPMHQNTQQTTVNQVGMQQNTGAGGAGYGYAPAPGYGGGYEPVPGQGFARGAGTVPLGRIGAAVAGVAGLVVLFGSLLNLYTISFDLSQIPDADTGSVEIGVGFYDVVPSTPIIALALPLLMLLAAVTALPRILGRGDQGAMVSAVSACAATLLALVLMFVNPLPSVELGGELAREFTQETGLTLDNVIDRALSTGPGAGLILALIFGALGAAGAILAYLRPEGGAAAAGQGALNVPGAGYGADPGHGGAGPMPGAPQTGQFTNPGGQPGQPWPGSR